VSIASGSIFRVSYVLGTEPPVAVIDVDKTDGPTPLIVQFDGSASSDPDLGRRARVQLDLDGDGNFGDSTEVAPSTTYTIAGTYKVKLQVTDPHGASGDRHVTITAGNSRPTAHHRGAHGIDHVACRQRHRLLGSATDPEQGTLPVGAHVDARAAPLPEQLPRAHRARRSRASAARSPRPSTSIRRTSSCACTVTDSAGCTDTTSVFSIRDRRSDAGERTRRGDARRRLGGGRHAVRADGDHRLQRLAVRALAADARRVRLHVRVVVGRGDRVHEIVAPADPASFVALFETTCGGSCDDTEVCTTDACDPQDGCTHTPIARLLPRRCGLRRPPGVQRRRDLRRPEPRVVSPRQVRSSSVQ
jgi:PKD repeat protein